MREVASKTTSSGTKIDGAVVSTTVTSWLAVAIFPAESAATHVTVVLPRPKNCGASLVIDSISPLSITVASPRIISFRSRLVASKIMSSGGYMVDFVVSSTITRCVVLAKLPPTSVAVQVTIVSPNGNTSGASLVMEITPTESDVIGFPKST